jgi:hypothetical protein
MTSALVLADSTSPFGGQRILSLELTFHRFILAEVNTYRRWSRSYASSRAVPVEKMLESAVLRMATPAEWIADGPGMTSSSQLTDKDLADAVKLWTNLGMDVVAAVANYVEAHPDRSSRLHKSLINRLLEPWQYVTGIITANEGALRHMIAQRDHADAQPEFRVLAQAVAAAIDGSAPTERFYHLPLVPDDEARRLLDEHDLSVRTLCMVSAARCGRVSFYRHHVPTTIEQDVERAQAFIDQGHWGPLEHVAFPMRPSQINQVGNLDGWVQYRHVVEGKATHSHL